MNPQGQLTILSEQFDAFSASMLADAPLESVAVCTAGWWPDKEGTFNLVWRTSRIAGASDYLRRGPGGAEVKPEFLAPAVKRCRETGEALLLAHTHPFSANPNFSGIDDGGEDALIPKVQERAPFAPHGGLVLGQHGASVRIWPPTSSEPVALLLRVLGRGTSQSKVLSDYVRQDLALGPGTAAALDGTRVAVIGTGGLGWEMATLLWMHGVGSLVLIDPDLVEGHNRPRLRGSKPTDVGRPKTEALASLLAGGRPQGEIIALQDHFPSARALEAVAKSDVLMTATDNLASRFHADRFARRLLIPLVDGGINIQLSGGHLSRIGGRVSVSYPTGACLSCMGIVDPDALAAEADPLGYRGRSAAEEAAVTAYNAVVAGLAAVQALELLLPFGSNRGSRDFRYDGLAGIVREISVPAPNRCGVCGDLPGAVMGELP